MKSSEHGQHAHTAVSMCSPPSAGPLKMSLIRPHSFFLSFFFFFISLGGGSKDTAVIYVQRAKGTKLGHLESWMDLASVIQSEGKSERGKINMAH